MGLQKMKIKFNITKFLDWIGVILLVSSLLMLPDGEFAFNTAAVRSKLWKNY